MTARIKLAIEVADDQATIWQAMADRCGLVTSATNAHCDALVTDDVERALAALQHERAVLLTDPWLVSREERTQLESSTLAMPAATARYRVDVAPMKQAVQDGKLGEPGLVRLHCWSNTPDQSESVAPAWIDVVMWLFSKSPDHLYALRRDSYQQIHLGFADGAMAMMDFHWFTPQEGSYTPEYENLSLIGSTGAAYADDHHNVHLWLHDNGAKAVRSEHRHLARAHLIESFARSIQSRAPFDVTWSEVAAVQAVVTQMQKAIASAIAVPVAEGGSHV